MSMPVGPEPTAITCPNCQKQVTTRTEPKTTTRTHYLAVMLCAICCWPCAACVYCTKCARSVDHFCSSCGNFVGSYER